MKDYIIPLTAITAITLIESIALFLGINGTLMAGVVAAIAGLGGYAVKTARDKRKKK